MKLLLIVLTVFTLIKTISYGVYEFKENKNKPAAIAIICLALGSCTLTSIMVYIR